MCRSCRTLAHLLPQLALTWAFNPSAAALTGSPTPLRLSSGLCLTPPRLTPGPAIIFYPPPTFSKVRRFFFSSQLAPFLVHVCASLFRRGSSLLDPAPAQFPVGGQHNVQSPTRQGVYSAAVPGVMGAPECPPPHPPLSWSAPGYRRSLTHKPVQRRVLQGRFLWVMMSPPRVKGLNMSKKHMSTSSQSPSPGSACRYELIWPRCAWHSSRGGHVTAARP